MSSEPIVRSLHDREDGTTQVTIVGEVDEVESATLSALWQQTLRPRQRVELDMDGVTFLNSAGIAALMDGHRQAVALDASLTITSASAIVRRVLQITGLGHLVSTPD